MIRKVIVPLDGSRFAEEALPLGIGLAGDLGAALEIVRVHIPLPRSGAEPIAVDSDSLAAEMRGMSEGHLEELGVRISKKHRLPVATELLSLHPDTAGALVAYLEPDGSELMVISTHGRGGFERVWMGSVADQVVRRARAPVVLVKPEPDTGPTRGARRVRRILATLDGSRLSEAIIPIVGEIARRTGAIVTLLQVVEPAMTVAATGSSWPMETTVPVLVPDEKQRERDRRDALRYLDEASRKLSIPTSRIACEAVISDRPATTILAQVKRAGPDLVALATHGRGGVGRLVIGSVADKVMRAARVPVLLYRPEPPSIRASERARTQVLRLPAAERRGRATPENRRASRSRG
jgi:nucleotide-binding universal stress UspA family protein